MCYTCNVCKEQFDNCSEVYRVGKDGNLYWLFEGELEHNSNDREFCKSFICKNCVKKSAVETSNKANELQTKVD